MKIIVGGAESGSGKTTFIRLILKLFPARFSVVKISVSNDFICETIVQREILNTPNKDTYYFLKGGAKNVFWIKGNRRCIGKELEKVISNVKSDVIVEGNSAIYFMNCDVSFFVLRDGENLKKESAVYFKEHAKYIVNNHNYTVQPMFLPPILDLNIKTEFENPSRALKEIIRSILDYTCA